MLTFILFWFVYLFVFFTCNKSSIVFILSLDPFLVDLLVLCPPKNAGGLLVFCCFQGAWNKDIGHIWVNQWWSHLAGGVSILCPLGLLESIWFLGVFGEYGIRTLARDGSSKGNKYISAIKVKIQVRKKSIASTEKDEKVI